MIERKELTISEAAEAMQLTEPDVRRLIQRGVLRSRGAAGLEVIASDEIRRYWFASAVAESEEVEARMNEEDERLGREAEERILDEGLSSVPLFRGLTPIFPALLRMAIPGILDLADRIGKRAAADR